MRKKVIKAPETNLTLEEKVDNKKDKKIKLQYFLKKLEENVRLKERQLEYSKKIRDSVITFASGPAGSAKTFSACYTLLKLLFEGKIEKIIFTKPIKESGENLGFLPGGVEDKIGPFMESFVDNCKKMLKEEYITFLIENKYIENRPLAYMRGCTLDKSGIFLDEAQNCTYEQLVLFITRLGENSKMIIAGDVTQRDIEKKKVALPDFIEMYKNIEGVGVHLFTKEDIVRNPLLVKLTEIYEDWKDKKIL